LDDCTEKLLFEVSATLNRARRELGISVYEPLRLVVGISGGKDSIALVYFLHAQAKQLGLEVIPAHFDHGLRVESEDEQKFVIDFCNQHGLGKPKIGKAPIKPEKENLEAFARKERYQFLNSCLESNNAHLIATAHHQADQVETLLFRLLTGRVLTSTYNIAKLDLERKIIRPFLSISRDLIEEFISEQNLEFVNDQSNDDLSRTRNRIRHELLPELREKYNPKLDKSLLDFVNRLSEDEEVIDFEVKRVMESLDNPRQLRELLKLPSAYAWRFLKQLAVSDLGEWGGTLGYQALQDAIKKIGIYSDKNDCQREFDLPNKTVLTLSKDGCIYFRSLNQ
jgi:tRNA(Ile)-lysidine synthetase-like protein